MRWHPLVLVGALVVLAAAAGAAAPDAAQADRAIAELSRSTLANETPDRDPLDRLDAHVLGDEEGADEVRGAVRRAQNASTPRTAVLEAEAALLAHAREQALAARDAGNASVASAWADVALARVDEARDLAGDAGPGAAPGDLRAALDAAIAVRAREAAWTAFLLDAAGHPDEASATAEGAQALVDVLVPDANRRLPDGVREAFEANATRVPQAVLEPVDEEGRYLFPGLAAGLTALQYGHDAEELEVLAQRAVDGALVATRAHREDPDRAGTLAQAAYERYGADRARLGLMGEGTNDALDDAYTSLRDAVREDAWGEAREAADRAVDAAGELALLGHGPVLEVEGGAVRPDRTHTYTVNVVRPPLAGITGLELTLTYNASVVHVAGAAPRALEGEFVFEGEDGTARVTVANATPVRDASRVVELAVDATGPPGAETTARVEHVQLTDADGDPVEPTLVRDATYTLAQISDGEDPAEAEGNASSGARSTPAPGPATALAAALGLALAGRRDP